MTAQIIFAALSLAVAIAGIVKWWLKKNKSDEALKKERALNAEIIVHSKDVRLSIEDAEKRAEEGKDVSERALAGKLSDDECRDLRSGRLPKGS